MSLSTPRLIKRDMAVTFHLFAPLYFIFVVYKLNIGIDLDKVSHIPDSKYYSTAQWYLTAWYYSAHVFYFFLKCLHRIYTTVLFHTELSVTINEWLDLFFMSIIFPVGLTVFATFWVISTYDGDMVVPSYMQVAFPMWCNHIVHTYIAVFIFVELFLLNFWNGKDYYWNKHVSSITSLVVFAVLYISCMAIGRYVNGRWVYPIFDTVPMIKVIPPVVCTAILFYFLGVAMNGAYFKYFAGDHTKSKKKIS